MARSFSIFALFAGLWAVQPVGGARIPTLRPTSEAQTESIKLPPLCDEAIVEEATYVMNGGEKHPSGDDWVSSSLLGQLMSASGTSITELWEALTLSKEHPTEDGLGYWVKGDKLCSAVVDYIRKEDAVLPPSSDIACYVVQGKAYCDLDVQPSQLASLGPRNDEDLPDFHDEAVRQRVNPGVSLVQATQNRTELLTGADDVDYALWEAVQRVANFFRIHPCQKPEAGAAPEGGEASSLAEDATMSYNEWLSGGERKHKQKEAQAKAYMSHTIRAFNAKNTRTQITKWFGTSAYSSPTIRREVLRVLNSIDHMISNVEAVYPGPECQNNMYAYVYPESYNCPLQEHLTTYPCTKYNGKFVFYLCPLYLRRESEMVETLVHEGSHHATAYTDDVDFEGQPAYGRSTCRRLARLQPSKALKNADNFCYYIQDVASEQLSMY